MFLRYAIKKYRFASVIFPMSQNQFDNVPESESDAETGFERVKNIFLPNKYERLSPQISNIVHTSLCGFFTGFALGGYLYGRQAYMNFIDHNKITGFMSAGDAKKKLQDSIMWSFGKGGHIWGVKLGLFVTFFSVFVTIMSTYRNKESVADYSIAGLIVGAAWKMSFGLRGMVAGAVVGGSLGLIGGCLIIGLEKLSGYSIKDHENWTHTMMENRNEKKQLALKEFVQEEDKKMPLIYEHQLKSDELNKKPNLDDFK